MEKTGIPLKSRVIDATFARFSNIKPPIIDQLMTVWHSLPNHRLSNIIHNCLKYDF
jgi:hypothetical protein